VSGFDSFATAASQALSEASSSAHFNVRGVQSVRGWARCGYSNYRPRANHGAIAQRNSWGPEFAPSRWLRARNFRRCVTVICSRCEMCFTSPSTVEDSNPSRAAECAAAACPQTGSRKRAGRKGRPRQHPRAHRWTSSSVGPGHRLPSRLTSDGEPIYYVSHPAR
jgi:hypothetical protein